MDLYYLLNTHTWAKVYTRVVLNENHSLRSRVNNGFVFSIINNGYMAQVFFVLSAAS
jgi:hypothetical protein